MQTVEGYYDGMNIKPLGRVRARPNQRLVITIMDEFIGPRKVAERESSRGILAKYANPELAAQEEGAWERAMLEKHGDG